MCDIIHTIGYLSIKKNEVLLPTEVNAEDVMLVKERSHRQHHVLYDITYCMIPF